ncbi:hypothetical protein K492DRAFT_189898 [Lichtheimia hyalospora FSU 10163]|nr:hypothetical protein K492DRAFT_189898 [Lichtheimia hyalospora FSU 10163]
MHSTFFAIAIIALVSTIHAFNMDCTSNVAGYWGQNSYGAANGGDKDNWQKPLHEYCNDDTIDMFPIAFLTKFFSTGGQPEINLANAS